MNDKSNIVCITANPFPIGMASTNRLISFCRGFSELGKNVNVFAIRPTENIDNIINKEKKGSFAGFSFEYTANTVIWPTSHLKRFIIYAKGVLICLKRIILCQNCSLIFSTSVSFSLTFPVFIIAKIRKIPFVLEIGEYPLMVYQFNKKYNKYWTWFYIKYFHKLFDGVVVVSQRLYDYYLPLIRRNARIIHIPITVETDRFKIKPYFNEKAPFVAYCGDMGNKKDGVPILIEAFSQFSKVFPEYKLYLIGYTKDIEEQNYFKRMVEKLNLKDRIIFTGKIPRNEMPMYLCNASILALARPNSKQAESGFPTKLGEYLATGNPVAVTKVGNIPDYLTHKINAYLCEPDSVTEFAKLLIEIASDYDEARKVGLQGKKAADNKFNYLKQSERILQFIKEL